MPVKAKVENMVSAIVVDQNIDLKKFASSVKGLEYNPNRFPGVVYRIREPKLAMLIFGSGKIICTGARSKEDITTAVKKLIEKFKEGKIYIKKKPRIEVQNIVASAKIGVKVNLDMLAMEAMNTEYEPEQFPGLVFRLAEPKTVMLVFRSGKMIITGAKTPEDANKAAEKTKRAIEKIGAII
ncbi:MAG: TATA-box-binding protein [Candidatus Altiarchaeales archaeon]|nr:TATA-box-binding protein [Candidatus Altiarchaeota archaeon]MBU4342373.1 TATA-box-binding protein [Candidatus Altiarchaeota archaeon]MBU4406646.1 TATA-box-binding protein [Candidatus Altiarchaeota archaeon]MBU4436884.1 TATA-box-binding protein [Candidatus Altiarchaeota archaeon]MCG2782228.1 TATA-box-binding protein [Candidatus Altiarchaeales archaeon]